MTGWLVACGGGFPPASLRKAQVVISKIDAHLRVVLRKADLNLITDLKLDRDEGTGTGALVVGNRGACRLSTPVDDQPSCIRYALTNLFEVTAVRVFGSNEAAFLAESVWGSPAAALLDEAGRLIWSVDAKYAAVAGPALVWLPEQRLDAVVMHIRDRMLFIDPRRSHTIFERKTSNLSDLLAIDVTGSGSRILSLDERGTLRLEAVDGSVIAESQLAFDFSEPTVATAPTGEITVVLSSPTALYLFGPILQPLAEIPVDLEKSLWLEAAASVPCGAKQGTCLASLFKGRGGWHRTVLFLHAPSGELLHHEILKGDYMSVMGLPAVPGEGWGFWVGGRGEVLEYRWR